MNIWNLIVCDILMNMISVIHLGKEFWSYLVAGKNIIRNPASTRIIISAQSIPPQFVKSILVYKEMCSIQTYEQRKQGFIILENTKGKLLIWRAYLECEKC